MPRMNGIDAVKNIRAADSLKHHKILAVTASVFPEFREKAIAAGFDGFLGKPFRTEELMGLLKKHLAA
jgi:CheY-like chemotaxis protein